MNTGSGIADYLQRELLWGREREVLNSVFRAERADETNTAIVLAYQRLMEAK